MLIDYTARVEKQKFSNIKSKLIVDVINYIKHNLHEPVNITKLAKSVFVSRTYLASKFKAETGLSLSEFYIEQKIEEAKSLLRYTNKSLSVIATYLGFFRKVILQTHLKNMLKCNQMNIVNITKNS